MFYVIVQDSYIGIFESVERLIPYMKMGIVPHQCTDICEVEEYLRTRLSFEELFDYGWEEELKEIQTDAIMFKRSDGKSEN